MGRTGSKTVTSEAGNADDRDCGVRSDAATGGFVKRQFARENCDGGRDTGP